MLPSAGQRRITAKRWAEIRIHLHAPHSRGRGVLLSANYDHSITSYTMDQPPGPFQIPPSPGTPLQQVSPDRMNQQRIPASPSLPNQLSNTDLKVRQSIDVQSKVAFINSLNQAGSPSRQQAVSTHAALQRALLGREEAESALRTSTSQLAESEVRQRKISERLESLMEELQSVRERQAHERQVFEKEVRKARKDAFRAGSALVKAQEDLKESRAEARNLRAETQYEKLEKEKSKQESFERAYTLAGLVEEVEVMREKMRAMEAAHETELLEQQSRATQREGENLLFAGKQHQESEEHTPRLSETHNRQKMLETDETARARQNRFERILPAGAPPSEPLAPMRCSVGLPTYQSKHPKQERPKDATADVHEQLVVLSAELQWENKLRTRAEELVHFLQMECQFNVCACRVAEKNGRRFIHDKGYEELTPAKSIQLKGLAPESYFQANHSNEADAPAHEIQTPEEDMFNISRQRHNGGALSKGEEPRNSPTKGMSPTKCEGPSPGASKPSTAAAETETSQVGLFKLSSAKNTSSPAIFSAEDMTYQSPIRAMIRPKSACSTPLSDSPTSPTARSPSASPYSLTPAFKTPRRQGPRAVHAQTTTMMVPLRDDDDVFSPAPGTPGTPVSREAALAQIRARRDRARSVAMSTSKSAPGSARRGLAGGLRDISAPGRF